VKGLGFQLDLRPGFLRESLLASETFVCALIWTSVSDWETESVKSSCVLAKLWAMGWVSPSSLSVSYVFDAEMAWALGRESS
jgi:hypothetical protein